MVNMTKRTTILLGGLLVLSLSINMFIAGSVFAHEKRHKRHAQGNYDHERIERMIAKSFPEAKQDEARAIMQAHRQNIRAAYKNYTQQKRQLVALLTSDAVSREELEEVMAGLREAEAQISEHHHAFTIDLSLISTAEMRQKFARRIAKRGPLRRH